MFRCLLLCFMCFSGLVNAEPPPPQTVFKFTLKTQDANTLVLIWQIKAGYFLYRDRIYFSEPTTDYVELSPLKLPPAKAKIDSLGKSIFVYRNQLTIPINMIGLHAGETILDLHYQGCADDGFCYPPESKSIALTIDKHLSLVKAQIISTSKKPRSAKVLTPQSKLSNTPFDNHHWAITLLLFLGLGVLLSFTPCVLPMIPVLSSILVGHEKNLSIKKAFFLSLSYVLSMSITYAMIGAVIALLGQNLQALFQSPWIISIFSMLFILLALSMFGIYNLELPTQWRAKLANLSYHQASGHYLGAAIMGALSTLILSPCVTAPLIGVLSYIATTGQIAFGMMALFCLGLGMGLPLLLVGSSLGRFLPRTGLWMQWIKTLFGLMLLGVSIDLLSRIIPASVAMFLWAGLLIFSGFMLGVNKKANSNFSRLIQTLAVLAVFYGLLLVIGASLGNTNPLKPLDFSVSKISRSNTITVTQLNDLRQLLEEAAKNQQPVLLDFYADWCTSCKAIESNILNHPEVLKAIASLKFIRVDITHYDEESRHLLEAFHVIAPPTLIFINQHGDECEALRMVGDVSLTTFLNHLFKLSNSN